MPSVPGLSFELKEQLAAIVESSDDAIISITSRQLSVGPQAPGEGMALSRRCRPRPKNARDLRCAGGDYGADRWGESNSPGSTISRTKDRECSEKQRPIDVKISSGNPGV